MRVFALQCSWFSLTSLWLVCEHAYTCHGGNLVHDSTAPLADKAEVRKPGCKWVNRETMELCLLFEDGNPMQGVLVESALFEDNGKEYGGGQAKTRGRHKQMWQVRNKPRSQTPFEAREGRPMTQRQGGSPMAQSQRGLGRAMRCYALQAAPHRSVRHRI